MSLATYDDLKAAVGAELNRADLATVVPDFIARFEADARRKLRDWLRFSVSLTNLTGDTAVAATVSEVLGVAMNDGANGANNRPLMILSREDYQRFLESNSNAASPQAVFVDFDADAPSTTLRFWPPIPSGSPVANLRVEAVKVLPSLSATQTTNALLREAPDLYLFGSCIEAATYLQHDERIPEWRDQVRDGYRELRIQSERRIYGAQPHPRTLPVVF